MHPRLLLAGLLTAMSSSAVAVDPLSGAALYADVQRYESFGAHRYGSPGAERTLAWIARSSSEQAFTCPPSPSRSTVSTTSKRPP